MTESLRPATGILVPPAPFGRGDPPARNAELTVFALGKDQEEIIPALRVLGEFNQRELLRFQGSLPCTLTLPAAYYARSNTFVALLRSSGTRFKIVSYPWLCPDEMASDDHLCRPTCSVLEMVESIT